MGVINLTRYGAVPAVRKAVIGLFTSAAVISGALSSVSADQIKIVALGDSLTQGYGLPAEQGFTAQLQRWLHENGAPEVRIINAGVSGDTTAGGLARFEWSLAEGGDAVIVELGGNDLLRAIDPTSSRANLDGILSKAAARSLPVLLTGMKAPTNYGTEFKQQFDAMYPELAAKYDAIYDPFFLEGMVGQTGLFQADGIHPNREGVAFLVERFGPIVLKLIERAQQG
ncbi:MAG: arylesterase [Pikeienuella sp.]